MGAVHSHSFKCWPVCKLVIHVLESVEENVLTRHTVVGGVVPTGHPPPALDVTYLELPGRGEATSIGTSTLGVHTGKLQAVVVSETARESGIVEISVGEGTSAGTCLRGGLHQRVISVKSIQTFLQAGQELVALWLQETRLVGGATVDGETGGVDDNTTGDGVLPEGVCDGVTLSKK